MKEETRVDFNSGAAENRLQGRRLKAVEGTESFLVNKTLPHVSPKAGEVIGYFPPYKKKLFNDSLPYF